MLGKHTDYAGGRSLLCAAERGLCVVVRGRNDSTVSVTDALNRQTSVFELSPDLDIPRSGWTIYPKTVARRIARNFGPCLLGGDIAFASDLPRAAGMSSSSTLVVAIFQTLAKTNRLRERDEWLASIQTEEDLAGYLGCVENGQSFRTLAGDRGVGTFGGSEDHTAILCSKAGCLAQYSFCPVRFEKSVRLPAEVTFVIGVSGVVASKTGLTREDYNRASQAAHAVLQVWKVASGSRAGTLAQAVAECSNVNEMRAALRQATGVPFDATTLLHRFDQFLLESETVVPQAVEALASGDLGRFGELVDRSQQAAEVLLRNQVPETVELVRLARALGAHAASAFGAGFGGSVWALVSRAETSRFTNEWRTAYQNRFPQRMARAEFLVTAAGPACTVQRDRRL